MHIPNREAVEAAFAASSSRPLLAEMERRYDQWTPLRALVRRWRRISKNFENGAAIELCAMELEKCLEEIGRAREVMK